MHELRSQGIRTRRFISEAGAVFGGRLFSRGHLYDILNNRIYLGEIVHKGTAYPGEHEPIIGQELWDQVQASLATNRRVFKSDLRVESPSFLKGLLFDSAGNYMSPSHGQKKTHRYRYYVSQALLEGFAGQAGVVARISAQKLEQLVEREVLKFLLNEETTKRKASEISRLDEGPRRQELRNFIKRVTLLADSITVVIRSGSEASPDDDSVAAEPKTLILPFSVQKRGGKTKLIASNNEPVFDEGPKQALVKAVGQAWGWRKKLEDGTITSITTIAGAEKTTISYISRMLRFAYLAPDILEAILDGKAPESFSGMMLRDPLPLSWADQRKAFGFAA